jgi:signal transduction histidine kinase/HAMP domain-containing protein
MDEPLAAEEPGPGRGLSFRTRLTAALVGTAIVPLAVFGFVVYLTGSFDPTVGRLLLFAMVVTILVAVLFSYLVATDLTRPLRTIATAVDRVSAGDLSTPIQVAGEDELARLAESHNRLAADLDRRDGEVAAINSAISDVSVRDGVAFLVARAAADAKRVFGLPEARLLLGDPDDFPIEEVVPGEMRPLRAVLRAGDESIGVLLGRLPPLRPWARADQDLLELYASEIAVAIRNAELYERVEAQNAQLLELDAAKDDFLRGVSHNLQTPLTSIRAHADQIGRDRPDRRLEVIEEQADRLSRMVRQLLTVTRLESGALHPRSEVLALAPRVRRTWEALAASEVEMHLDDQSKGWLAIGDVDQLDQVLWALLDNAVKYGKRSPVSVDIGVDEAAKRLRLTIADGGPGVTEGDRARMFQRFVRGQETATDEGSGLGLYVSRELTRAMEGDLVLEPAAPDRGAAFSIYLPGEPPDES